MKKLLFIFPLLILISFTSINDCELNSNLKLDRRLLQINDSLINADTLILYRHWVYTNGENGYAKALFSKSGQHFQKTLVFDSENNKINESNWKQLPNNNSAITFLAHNTAKKIDSSYPSKHQITLTETHSGQHIIQFIVKNKIVFCDKISETDISFNYKIPEQSLINYLRDTTLFTPIVMKMRSLGPLYYLNGKPIFSEDPEENMKLKKEYKKAKRKNK